MIVFSYLQSKGKPFEDSPNDVLRRPFKLNANQAENGNCLESLGLGNPNEDSEVDFGQSKDYTFRSLSGFSLKGRRLPARSFKDVIVNLYNVREFQIN